MPTGTCSSRRSRWPTAVRSGWRRRRPETGWLGELPAATEARRRRYTVRIRLVAAAGGRLAVRRLAVPRLPGGWLAAVGPARGRLPVGPARGRLAVGAARGRLPVGPARGRLTVVRLAVAAAGGGLAVRGL